MYGNFLFYHNWGMMRMNIITRFLMRNILIWRLDWWISHQSVQRQNWNTSHSFDVHGKELSGRSENTSVSYQASGDMHGTPQISHYCFFIFFVAKRGRTDCRFYWCIRLYSSDAFQNLTPFNTSQKFARNNRLWWKWMYNTEHIKRRVI